MQALGLYKEGNSDAVSRHKDPQAKISWER